jgi:hypothetical protein
VDAKRRRNLLRILEELSKVLNHNEPNFIIIGAVPLLMTDYLDYMAQWDIDILFRDNASLREFVSRAKPAGSRIVNYDDDFMASAGITSFHTAWSFDRTWFNVDYILRDKLFDFYAKDLRELNDYNRLIKLEGSNYQIRLWLAHPWDIFLEKALSPRAEQELALRVDMSVDIRHIFLIYQREKDCPEFWARVVGKARKFGLEERFKKNLLTVFNVRSELGYGHIEISDFSLEQLR